jgi:hypothetical protein
MNRKIDSESELWISEVKLLQRLRQQLKHPLNKIDELQFDDQGYIEENHLVVGLQLQNMGLSTLPKAINEFQNLKNLKLSHNNFHSIDLSPLQVCVNLETLELDDCKIRAIDLNPLHKCVKLSMLKLNQNLLETIDLNPLRHCESLSSLILDQNQLEEIDLTPLQTCSRLDLLSLKQNRISDIDLFCLRDVTSLISLGLSDNLISSLDITPLFSLNHFRRLWVDDEVTLLVDPVHRDYSLNLRWFTSKYLPHVTWQVPEDDVQIQTLYRMYDNIIRHFRHEEFWADYRDRRLQVPPDQSYEVRFFEFAVKQFLTIKNQARSDSSVDQLTDHRKGIETQFQDRFLGSKELIPVLKDYLELDYESELTVEFFEGAIVIFHFWPIEGPSRLPLVQSISWVKVVIDEQQQSYQVTRGFNRGLLQAGQKYHPIPPPEEFPSNLFTSTEVMYEIDTYTTPSIPDLLSRCYDWLRERYFPQFDPDRPEVLYS